MVSPARDLPEDLEGVEPLWQLRLGTHQYALPTIDRGRMYLALDDAALDRPGLKPTGGGLLLAIDEETGRRIWQFVSPRYMEGMAEPYHYDQWKAGIASGPLVDGDRVYVVGNRGEILCLDRDGQANGNQGPFLEDAACMGISEGGLRPDDGDLLWRFNLVAELDVVPHDVCGSTLLLHGDLLYATTSNGIDGKHLKIPRPRASSLIALEKRTGRLVARDGEHIGERMFHGHWSSPALARLEGRDLILFGGGDGVLYAFRPAEPSSEGAPVQILERVWSHDANPPEYRTAAGKPIPYSKWNKQSPEGPSEIIGTPVFHEGRVYVTVGQSPIHGAGKGQLSCVDAATGDGIWRSTLVGRSLATPSVADGLVYVADYSGEVHCFDASSGERFWVHRMDAGAWGASTFVADGKVYASCESNTLWILAAGREKRVLSSIDLESMPITPVAVDGILYLSTQKRLRAYPGKTKVSQGGAAKRGS
jgi:outer membrane protein assembly factor BamB